MTALIRAKCQCVVLPVYDDGACDQVPCVVFESCYDSDGETLEVGFREFRRADLDLTPDKRGQQAKVLTKTEAEALCRRLDRLVSMGHQLGRLTGILNWAACRVAEGA